MKTAYRAEVREFSVWGPRFPIMRKIWGILPEENCNFALEYYIVKINSFEEQKAFSLLDLNLFHSNLNGSRKATALFWYFSKSLKW